MRRVGDTVAGRFELTARIEKSGMGIVFRARDTSTGRDVAIKFLKHAKEEDRLRFEREAGILERLRHPRIVRHVAHGLTDGDAPYLVMEWLEGEDLAERLARGPLSVAATVALGAGVADALGAIHVHGIVHRDVKPANLFLVDGDVERVTLLDFGIARHRDEPRDITVSGSTVGTPAYMAPEQVRGDPALDERADIFALGCVLYECLAGRPAFVAAHQVAVLVKILFDVPLPVRQVCRAVPARLDELVGRMLEKDCSDRPRDVAAVSAVLLDASPGSEPSASSGSRKLSIHEQRRVSVILTGPTSWRGDPPVALDEVTTPVASMETLRARGADDIHAVAARYVARLERLQDGELVLVLTAAVAATDLLARAARCALALQRLLPGVPLVLATGRADISGRLPVGDAIDRAAALLRDARHEQGPDHGPSIRIDEVSAGLLDARFEVSGDHRSLLLTGEREPLGVARTLLGKRTICFGRGWELEMLRDLLDQCITERIARAVLVTGPPGIGKSRVCQELVSSVEERPETVAIWWGRGDAMRAGSPLGILGNALRHAFGLGAGEPAELRRTKILARLSGHFAGAELARVAGFLGELLEAHFADDDNIQLLAARRDPILLGDQMLRAFTDFVAAETAAHPVLLVLEDFHWGDHASARFVDACLRISQRRLMVLATARPEVAVLFPRLWEDRGAHEIRLSGLTRRAAENLVRDVLGHDTPATTITRIVARADGNPFFLEELIRAVAEGKGDRLPETVIATVQLRLEALEEEPRHILRAASIFGEVFWRDGVEALIDARGVSRWLAQLEELELIAPAAHRSPQGAAYVFRHALVRDAAYGMLTGPDRQLGHRLAGEWLERTGVQDGLLLAEHFEIGNDLERASRWYERAAEQALEANDLEAVVARAAKGLACGAAGEAAGRIHLLAATAHNWRGALREGADAARSARRALSPGSGRWYAAIERLAWASGALDQLEDLNELGSAVLASWSAGMQEPDAIIAACVVSGWLNLHGQYARADELATRIDDIVPEAFDPIVAGHVYTLRCHRAERLHRLPAAARLAEAAREAFGRGGDMRNACLWGANVGHLLSLLGAYERAKAVLERTLRDAERIGVPYVEAWTKAQLAHVRSAQGFFDDARALATAAADMAERRGDGDNGGRARVVLARVLLATGALEDAHAEAQRAVDMAASHAPQRAVALAVLARVLLARARASDALDAASASMLILDSLRTIQWDEALVRLAFVEALQASGDVDAARAALAVARDRILSQADEIDAPDTRLDFLERVPEHARLLGLAQALGLAGAPAPP